MNNRPAQAGAFALGNFAASLARAAAVRISFESDFSNFSQFARYCAWSSRGCGVTPSSAQGNAAPISATSSSAAKACSPKRFCEREHDRGRQALRLDRELGRTRRTGISDRLGTRSLPACGPAETANSPAKPTPVHDSHSVPGGRVITPMSTSGRKGDPAEGAPFGPKRT